MQYSVILEETTGRTGFNKSQSFVLWSLDDIGRLFMEYSAQFDIYNKSFCRVFGYDRLNTVVQIFKNNTLLKIRKVVPQTIL